MRTPTLALRASAVIAVLLVSSGCEDAPPTTTASKAPEAAPAATTETAPPATPKAAEPGAATDPAPAAASGQEGSATTPATAVAPSPSAAPAPAASSAAAAGSAPTALASAAAPTGPVAGQPSTLTASAKAEAPFKCNPEFPTKFEATGGSNATFPSPKTKGGCSSTQTASVSVPFVPTAAGPGTVVGTLKYGICRAEECQKVEKQVTLSFNAAPAN